MFGLMKNSNPTSDPQKIYTRRLHYCGTCKTIGSLYGQTARVLLSSDIVFLAELLSSLSAKNQNLHEWDSTYQSFNCLSIPQLNTDMPISLQYAAAINVILAEITVEDHIIDSNWFAWKLAKRFLSNNFRQASTQLAGWNFPLHEIWQWAKIQNQREKKQSFMGNSRVDEVINSLAEPTANMTGISFSYGARLIGNEAVVETLFNIGYKFGKLIYILDAFEDYIRDRAEGDFNVLAVAYNISEEMLPSQLRSAIISRLEASGKEIETLVSSLPIPEERASLFNERLRINLAKRLYKKPILPINFWVFFSSTAQFPYPFKYQCPIKNAACLHASSLSKALPPKNSITSRSARISA